MNEQDQRIGVAQSGSEDDTIALGERIGRACARGDVVGIVGELGAGKTRLVRGVCAGLGVDPSRVSSPTFTLANEYQGRDAAGSPLSVAHLDAYRLEGADELDTIGWDTIHDGSSVVLIEWADRLGAGEQAAGRGGTHRGSLTPSLLARMTHAGETIRGVEVSGGAWLARASSAPVVEWMRDRGARLPRGWASCPTTKRPVPPDRATFPFFDERARMADLDRWMRGEYVVSREIRDDEEAFTLPRRPDDAEPGERGEAR